MSRRAVRHKLTPCTQDPLRDLPTLLPLDQRDLVLPLQVEPELGAVAEVAVEALCRCSLTPKQNGVWRIETPVTGKIALGHCMPGVWKLHD